MKKQIVGLALMAVFNFSFAPQASALDIPPGTVFKARTNVDYQQANNSGFGKFDIYKAESGQLLGKADYAFRTKVEEILSEKIDGNGVQLKAR